MEIGVPLRKGLSTAANLDRASLLDRRPVVDDSANCFAGTGVAATPNAGWLVFGLLWSEAVEGCPIVCATPRTIGPGAVSAAAAVAVDVELVSASASPGLALLRSCFERIRWYTVYSVEMKHVDVSS